MFETIKLKKGLNLPLKGQADKAVLMEVTPGLVALKPTDFKGLVPKLLVKEGDTVKAGSPLFADKMDQRILFTSPVSGKVQSIVRGEKRKLLAVVVKADAQQVYENFPEHDLEAMSGEQIKDLLMKTGLWASMIQRPYGIVPKADAKPKAIFISAFDTAPNAPDMQYVLGDCAADIQRGITALKKMTGVAVHLCLEAATYSCNPLHRMDDVVLHVFEGPHPTGNVGVQIHHVSPIVKGETVWTISPVFLAAIGKLLSSGKLDLTRLVVVTGSCSNKSGYVRMLPGTCMSELTEVLGNTDGVRVVSGNVLTGTAIGVDGYLGYFDNQISLLQEGDYREMFGWANPIRSKLYSYSKAYLSWLCPRKKYGMDTNVHGGVRAFMFNKVYSDVLPMYIFPVFLCKACMTKDIDAMEKYGIYEVLPEDLATCEFVCPSKVEWQKAIGEGIDLMLKEMA